MTSHPFGIVILATALLAGGTAIGYAQSDTTANKAQSSSSAKTATDDGGTNGKDGEHYSAPSGGFSSGAHLGNESPTKKGNSTDVRKEKEVQKN